MQDYNQQQQAVILKGIAQQILQMNVPSFKVASKLFEEFDQHLVDKSFCFTGKEIKRAIIVLLIMLQPEKRDKIEGNTFEEKSHTVLHYVLKQDDNSQVNFQTIISDLLT